MASPGWTLPIGQHPGDVRRPAVWGRAHHELVVDRSTQWAILTSVLVHSLLVIVVGLLTIDPRLPREEQPLLVEAAPPEDLRIESFVPLTRPQPEPVELRAVSQPLATTNLEPTLERMDVIASMLPDVPRAPAVRVDSAQGAAPGDYRAAAASGLTGLRSTTGRRAAVEARGGTAQSEAAVDRALEWLLRHQNPDGSWSFDHRRGACKNDCANPGVLTAAKVAATSLALLPFLGAGHTHREGPHQKPIRAGLSYLYKQMLASPGSQDLTASGSMYSHGLATIVFCEAYTLTHDRWLLLPAQKAVNFIVQSQDHVGGGWRYSPGQPGDLSVVGWQLMALKSGQSAYLQVPPQTLTAAGRFLDSVAVDGGAAFLYIDNYPEPRPSTSAIGLLCRMYLGVDRDHPALAEGVRRLMLQGPSPSDVYYNYYATQVLLHYDGPLWRSWNERMREQLIATQSRAGHADGSWYVAGGYDQHNQVGGRLYCTALAALTLEVYYRHLPLFRPLDDAPGAPAP